MRVYVLEPFSFDEKLRVFSITKASWVVEQTTTKQQ